MPSGRRQSQYPGQGYFGQSGPVSPDFGIGLGNLAPPNPMLDHQAASEMIEDINAGALRTNIYPVPDLRNPFLGVHFTVRADGQAFPLPDATAKLWVPVPGGPAFLLGPNFYAVHTYNPSMNYTLAIVHLGDRCIGGEAFVQSFPGSERAPTLAEVQEIQRRLTALGFDTGGADGRVGNGTMLAVRDYQRKVGMDPADGYAGIRLLARLRQGP